MSYLDNFFKSVKNKNEHEVEFLQAVEEFAHSVVPFIEKNPKYKDGNLLNQLVEPERVIVFILAIGTSPSSIHELSGSAPPMLKTISIAELYPT